MTARRPPPLSPPPPPLVLLPDDWPDIDQRLWDAGENAGDDLDDPGHARGLQPTSRRNARRGYGRFLAVLAAADDLDPTLDPASRVTRARANAYLTALRAAGNKTSTIIARFMELRVALRIMQPETYAAFAWLTVPGGRSLSACLPVVRRKPIVAIEGQDLWGLQLMDDATKLRTPRLRSLQFRNGLMVAILAAFALRQRSLASLELGRSVFCQGDGYRIVLEPADVKNRRRLEYDVPPELVPYVCRYLAEARVVLLGRRTHDWFWVNQQGGRLGMPGIDSITRRGSETRHGKAHGTHQFRYDLATTAARLMPGNPGVAAAVMGDAEATVSEYYDKTTHSDAADAFLASFEEDLRETEALARRLFGR